MIDATDIYFLWTESPLHAGTGSSGGVVDLPIQRDVSTGYPIVHFSTIKGALRDHFKAHVAATFPKAKPEATPPDPVTTTNAVFGPEDPGGDYSAAVSMSDARLVLFPVRSLRGVFAWITCPLALAYLRRDLGRSGLSATVPTLTGAPTEGSAWISANSPVAFGNADGSFEIVLEEYAFDATVNPYVASVAKWLVETAKALPKASSYEYWKHRVFKDDRSYVVVLSDDDFQAFVQHSTDVVHRNKIDNNLGRVEDGGLWTEENLPSDCLMYSALHTVNPRAANAPALVNSAAGIVNTVAEVVKAHPVLRMGGNVGVGRGITRLTRIAHQAEEAANVPAAKS